MLLSWNVLNVNVDIKDCVDLDLYSLSSASYVIILYKYLFLISYAVFLLTFEHTFADSKTECTFWKEFRLWTIPFPSQRHILVTFQVNNIALKCPVNILWRKG